MLRKAKLNRINEYVKRVFIPENADDTFVGGDFEFADAFVYEPYCSEISEISCQEPEEGIVGEYIPDASDFKERPEESLPRPTCCAPPSEYDSHREERKEALHAKVSEHARRPARPEHHISSIDDLMQKDFHDLDRSFAEMLMYWLVKKDINNAVFYKRARITKQTFSRILSQPMNPPTKAIALACVIGLKLDLEEARDLLMRAGYAISHSNITDVIVEAFIQEKHYNVDDINMCIYNHDGALIGSGKTER